MYNNIIDDHSFLLGLLGVSNNIQKEYIIYPKKTSSSHLGKQATHL